MESNAIGRDGAIALSNAIANNKKLIILSLFEEHIDNKYVDKEAAITLIRSLINNNTVIKLDLGIELYNDDISVVTEEAEKVNFKKKLHKEHIVEFDLNFYQLNYSYLGKFTTMEVT